MTGKGAHNQFLRICVFYYIKIFLHFVFAFLLFFPILTGLAGEQAPIELISPQPDNEPVYFMPDQSGSPVKLGVSITPNQYIRSLDYRSYPSNLYVYDRDYKMAQNADVTTVVRIALDEFKFFSGLNQWIHGVEKTVNGYSRKFMLIGELNLDPQNMNPVDYIEKVNLTAELYAAQHVRPSSRNFTEAILSQFEINKVTWNIGFYLNSPQMAFKLRIGDAVMIHSSVGENIKVGAMIKLSI